MDILDQTFNKFFKENTVAGVMGTDTMSQFSNDDIYAPDDARLPTLLGIGSVPKKSKKKKKKKSEKPLIVRRELIKENSELYIIGFVNKYDELIAKKFRNSSKFRQTGFGIFPQGEMDKFTYVNGTLVLEPSFDVDKKLKSLKDGLEKKGISIDSIKKKKIEFMSESEKPSYGLGIIKNDTVYFKPFFTAQDYSQYTHSGIFNMPTSDRFRYENGTVIWSGESSMKPEKTDIVKRFLKKKGYVVNSIKYPSYDFDDEHDDTIWESTIMGQSADGAIKELAIYHSKGNKAKLKTLLGIIRSELEIGIEIEKEHTSNEETAKKIAIDHLKETPFYYTKLKNAGL